MKKPINLIVKTTHLKLGKVLNSQFSKKCMQVTHKYTEALNIISHQRNANQNHSELSLQIHWDDYSHRDTWLICRKIKTLIIAGGNVKWWRYFGKEADNSSKS
jgi:hypothetical protein